jgi:O-antigen/teichoic acid export membrane protein
MLRRIFKNTLWISAANIIGKGLAFVLMIYIARYLGDTLYGKFSFALSLVGILAVIADFGLGNFATREIARANEKTQKYLDNIIVIKILLGIITYILIIISLILLNKDDLTKQLTYLAGLYIIINSFEQFFYTVFRAWEKMKFEAICRIAYDVFLFILGVILIQLNFGARSLMIAYILATCLSFFLSITFVKKYFTKFKVEIDFPFWKKVLKESWPFALSSIFTIIYFRIDIIMLSEMRTDQEVGWYNAAYNLVFALILIPSVFDIIFYPILSKAFRDKNEYKDVCKKVFIYAITLAVPLGILFFLIKEPLIQILYNNKYPLAAPIFGILVWSFVFTLINRFPFIITAANLQILITKQLAFGMILNIILNFFLIPKFGTTGAAWATVIAEIATFFLLAYYALIKYRKQIFL